MIGRLGNGRHPSSSSLVSSRALLLAPAEGVGRYRTLAGMVLYLYQGVVEDWNGEVGRGKMEGKKERRFK